MIISELFALTKDADDRPSVRNNFHDKRYQRKQMKYIEIKVYCEDSSTGCEVPLPVLRISC